MKTSTKIIGGVVALVIVVGVVTYLNRTQSSGAGLVSDIELTERPVQTMAVEPRRLVETIAHTSTLEANRDVILAAEVAGKVQKVHKDLGDVCQKSEVLIQLDPATYGIAVKQAKAGLQQARAAFEQSKRDLGRAELLHQRQVGTAHELERAQSGEKTAAAMVEQAEAALRMAQRNLHETTIRCPFDGVVAQRMVDVGQLVGPQTPLARFVDTTKLKLTLTVGAAQLARLETGQKAKLTDPSLPELTYQGEVARLGVAADPITRTFPVEVTVPGGEGGPKPGQVVRALIELAVHENVLAVPRDALRGETAEPSLFVATDGKAREVRVVTGPRIDSLVIVREGLSAGARVIVVGHDNLKTGDSIVDVSKQKDRPESTATASSDP